MNPQLKFPGELMILEEIKKELKADKKAHPNYPDHVCGQASLVAQKAGDIVHWSVIEKYGRGFTPGDTTLKNEIRNAAIATAVQAIRFIENLK